MPFVPVRSLSQGGRMPVSFHKKPKKPSAVIHVDDPVEEIAPAKERDRLPCNRFNLDPRIKADCVEVVGRDELTLNPRNAKKHPERQIALLAKNIKEFGFTTPLLVDERGKILAGHARYMAAERVGLDHLPVIRLSHLTDAQKRALAIADNKLALLGEWDFDILAEEFSFLFDPRAELDFDPRIIGFETVEVDQIVLGEPAKANRADPADQNIPVLEGALVTTTGDVWVCDQHRLLCGDATNQAHYAALMGTELAQILFTDPPYNVPNAGHVTGRDGVREFAMAHGEMTPSEFTAFLSTVCANILTSMTEGAVGFFCMDWRHLTELRAAGTSVFGSPKNLIAWVKNNAGMGSFYRSQHELIYVFAAPGKPINNFGLGEKGRYRSNVWEYPGFNSFGRGRDKALAMHPTVKPVAMVADALMDCSNRGGIILDPFGGSGTTMIAAERTKRRARLMEIDPLYCDTIVQRWQDFTGEIARLAETNETFEEVKARRGAGRK
jgi:DNA modification methylase